MADVRALLRQQRAARRIEHPHASYSDVGKLTCTVCNELVKTEALWDSHIRSADHRQRQQSTHQSATKNGSKGYAGFVGQGPDRDGHSRQPNKRKLTDSDDEMPDHDGDPARRKRAKADVVSADQTPVTKDDATGAGKPITPPLTRRTSGTPIVGVELEIPSRPATPSTAGTPMSITPKAAPIGRSPLIPDEPASVRGQPEPGPAPSTTDLEPAPAAPTATTVPVDEDEWAAFEADLVHGTAAKPSHAKPAMDSDAVISAPVMSAAEVAAKSEEEERAKRRALVDIQIEDEREDATRALETEFEVMEELEARAQRLRERREQLRVQAKGKAVVVEEDGDGGKGAALGKENAAVVHEGESEEEDEDDDVDDWDGFRFRA